MPKYRWLLHKDYSQRYPNGHHFYRHQVSQVYIVPDMIKIGRSEAMIVSFGSLLEDVIEHLVHVGTVEARYRNLRHCRNRQAQILVAYPRHGATSG